MSENKDAQYREEEWRPTRESDLYEVSTMGRLRSLKSGKMIGSYVNKQGYSVCSISVNGKTKGFRIHRLVASAFIPKIKGKHLVNHINSIRHDNRLENLEWCTNRENCLHGINLKKTLGTPYHSSKLTEEMVEEILKIGKTAARIKIAEKFNVNPSNITLILNGETWRHVGDRIGFDYSTHLTRKALLNENQKLRELVIGFYDGEFGINTFISKAEEILK